MASPRATAGSRRYRGAAAADRRAQRREQLLLAAIQVYGERGFRNATVKAVCAAAGLTERYFYESFENSEALLVACYETVTEALIGNMAEIARAAPGEPADKVRALLTHYFDALRREPRSARVFLVEVGGVSPALDRAFEVSLSAFGDLIARTATGNGAAADRTDPLLRAGAVGGVLHIALAWIAGDYRRPLAEVVDAAAPICLILREESRDTAVA